MNHIYRLIWNQAMRAWVVASELACSRGKGASITISNVAANQAGIGNRRASALSLSTIVVAVALALLAPRSVLAQSCVSSVCSGGAEFNADELDAITSGSLIFLDTSKLNATMARAINGGSQTFYAASTLNAAAPFSIFAGDQTFFNSSVLNANMTYAIAGGTQTFRNTSTLNAGQAPVFLINGVLVVGGNISAGTQNFLEASVLNAGGTFAINGGTQNFYDSSVLNTTQTPLIQIDDNTSVTGKNVSGGAQNFYNNSKLVANGEASISGGTQTFYGSSKLDVIKEFSIVGGTQNFYGSSSLNSSVVGGIVAGSQNFYETSSLNALVGGAIGGASTLGANVNFHDHSALNSNAAGGLIITGELNFNENTVLNANTASSVADTFLGSAGSALNFHGSSALNVNAAGAITTSLANINFYDNSTLNAAKANAFNLGYAGELNFYNNSALNASAENAVTSSRVGFYDNSTLNANATNAVVSGTQYFYGHSALNINAASAVTGGSQYFWENSTLNANVANAIVGGKTTLLDNSVINANAANAITGGTYSFSVGGTLNVFADSALANGVNLVFGGGGTLDLHGYSTSIGKITNSGGVITNNGFRASILSIDSSAGNSIISGGVQDGSGRLGLVFTAGNATLDGSNNYSAGTRIDGGTLSISADGNLGEASGSLTFGSLSTSNSGTLRVNGSTDINRSILLSGTGTFDTAGNVGLTGPITGAGGLIKRGSYGTTLTLSGTNSYTGATTVNGGTLKAGAAGAFVNNTAYTVNDSSSIFPDIGVIHYGGELDLGGFDLSMSSLSGTGGRVAVGTANLTINQAGNTTYAGTFTGTGNVIKSGAGTLTLAVSPTTFIPATFTGNTTVAAGTLRIDGALGGNVAVRGGVLTGSGSIGGNADLTNGGVFKGTGGETLRVGGNVVMDSTSVVNASLGAPSGAALIDAGGNLTLDGTLNVTDAGGFGYGVYRLFNYAGSLTDNGLGIGAMPSGINASDLTVQTSSAHTVNLVSSGIAAGALSFWDGGNTALHDNGAVDGGAGTWTANASNWTGLDGTANGSYQPNPTFAVFQTVGGVVTVDNTAGTIGVTGMQFAADGYRVEGDAITLQGGGGTTIRVGDGTTAGAAMTATIASALTGNSGLVKSDLGTLILTGANSYTGGTQVAAGTLVLKSALSGSVEAYGDGVLDVAASGVISGGSQTFSDNSTLNVRATDAITGGSQQFGGNSTLNILAANAIHGSTLSFSDSATINASASGAIGNTSIRLNDAVTLNVMADNALTAQTSIQFGQGGTLRLNGHSTSIDRIAFDATNFGSHAGTITNDGAANAVLTIENLTGAATGSIFDATIFGGVIQDGSGTGKLGLTVNDGLVQLNGANTYTGGTTVNGGTLAAGVAGALVDNTAYIVNGGILSLGGFDRTMSSLSGTGGQVVTTNGARLTVAQAGDTTYAGILSGYAAFTKSGAGTLTLTGDSSTFAGGTTISAGTLRVNGTLGGNVAARTSGVLAGSGHITGNADLTGGGVFSGTSGQTLHVDGNVTMDASSVLNAALGAPSNTALINVGGNLTLNGTLNVTDTGGFGAGVYRLVDYTGSLIDNGLDIGTTPAGVDASDLTVQTSVANTVNLVSSAAFTGGLSFWDGGNSALHNNGQVNGGTGAWTANDSNWIFYSGTANGPYQPNPTFAVFQATGGLVTVDNSAGVIGVTGMQFAADGYRVEGDSIALQGTGGKTTIRVGDGTAAGAAVTATIASELTGTSALEKTDYGRLILTGTNTYSGGTVINAGALSVSSDANLGDAAGGITIKSGTLATTASFDTDRAVLLDTSGTLDVASSTTLGMTGALSGSGQLVKVGNGTLAFSGDASAFGGSTNLQAGTFVLNSAWRGTVEAHGDSVLDAAAANAISGFDVQLFHDDSTLKASVGNAIAGGYQYFNDSSVLDASASGALAAGSQTFSGSSRLDASAANAVTGGFQVFTGDSVLNASVTDAVTGGSQQFSTNSRLNILAANGVHGSNLNFKDTATLNAGVANAITSGGLIFSGESKLDASVAGAVTGAGLTFSEDSRLNVLAANALTTSVSVNFDNGPGGTGGVLALNGYSTTIGRISSVSTGSGVITNDGASDGVLSVSVLSGPSSSFSGVIQDGSGAGKLGLALDAGNLSLRGTNTYTGGTTVNGGSLTAGAAGAFVSNTAYTVNGGTLDLNGYDLTMKSLSGAGGTVALGAGNLTVAQATNTTYAGVLSGTGGFTKSGAGTLTLTGDSSSFGGNTMVSSGTLRVDGTLGGDVAAHTTGTLAGAGHITGNADLTNGGVIAGVSGQTLRVDGNVTMDASSTMNAALGGPSSTALVSVGGNLTLNGTLNVSDVGGFGAGVYRLMDYSGALTGSGLAVGTTPTAVSTSDLDVQTAVSHQVNLVYQSNGGGQPTELGFWDGGNAALHDNGAVDGGAGTWRADGSNWTQANGAVNGAFAPNPTFAVFQNTGGVVTVDNTAGTIGVTGMQFAADGYRVTGDSIALQGAGGKTTIRVGNGTTAGASMTATIASALTGASALEKTDFGKLTLTGTNTYSGGTAINAGTLSVSSNANLGDATGSLVFNGGTLATTAGFTSNRAVLFSSAGTFDVASATTLGLAGTISGAGPLTKAGSGTLALTGDASSFTGGTTVSAGTLRVDGTLGGDVAAHTTGTLAGAGHILGNADLTNGGVVAATSGQTLRVGGNVTMDATSTMNAALGAASSTALVDVGGNLALNGTLKVTDAGGFGAGVYRLFDYGGTLSGSGLAIGTAPAGVDTADLAVQTAVSHQVNLVYQSNGGGQPTELGFWDGGNAALHDNGAVDGGAGTWRADGSNWTQADGAVNGAFAPNPTFAVFQNTGGVVTVDNTAGTIGVTGMQFAADGYRVTGDSIALQGAGGKTTIRVGDGTTAGASMTATIASALTGASALEKTDYGTLILTGANTYTGGTQVAAGTLLGNASSIRGDIANAGTVQFDQAADASFAGNIAGLGGTNGTMVKSGVGNLALTGLSSLNWTIQAGGLLADASRFTGNAAIQAGANLTFNQSANAVYAGVISGAGDFTKAGAGSLNLTGDSSAFAGTTNIVDGLLSVNGKLGGTLNIAGGKLGGNGTIGNLSVSGIVAPGNSIGTLNVGNITLNPGSIYQVEVNAAGQSDKIIASGTATINGSSVQVLAGTGNYAPQTQYTILTANGGRTGQFSGVTSNLAFLDPSLSYDANNVYLTMTRNNISFQNVGITPNQIATAGGAESLGLGNPVYDAVLNLSAPQAQYAFDQLSGEIHASAKTAIIEDSRFVRNAANDRLRSALGATGASKASVAAYGANGQPEQVAATHSGPVFWSNVYGSWGKTDGNGNAASLDRSSSGLLMGVDSNVGDWRLGVLTGYGQTHFNTSNPSASGSSKDYHLGAYGGTAWGNLSLRTGMAYTWHDIDTKRSVAMPGLADSLKDHYHGGTLQAFGELAYGMDLNGVRVEPFANVAHVRQRTDGNSEQGGVTALQTDKASNNVTFSTLGLRGEHTFDLGSTKTTLTGSVGWRHAVGDITPTATQRFAGGSAFTVSGVPIAKNSAVIETGLDVAISRNSTLNFSYMGQLASGAQDHGVKASLSVRF